MNKLLSDRVRQTLRRVRRWKSGAETAGKLEAIRLAFEHEFPTADMEEMLEEIEREYLRETDPPLREETRTGNM